MSSKNVVILKLTLFVKLPSVHHLELYLLFQFPVTQMWSIERKRDMPEVRDARPKVETSVRVNGNTVQFTYTLTLNGTTTHGKSIDVPENLYREMNDWPPFITLTHGNQKDHVFATAADENYYPGVILTIASIQKHFPGYTIYFYDLGINNIKKVRAKMSQI